MRNIDLSSPLMNLFAIKYLLIDAEERKFIQLPHFFIQPGITHSPSPPLPFNELVQHFDVSRERKLAGINLFIGNYRNKNFDSDVLLELYDSKKHELLGTSVKEKKFIKDNIWIYFDFEKPIILEQRRYEFSLVLMNKNTHSMLSGWSTRRTQGINSYLTVNVEKTHLSFKYSLHEATDKYRENYKVHRLEPAVAVVENLTCPEGPYLVSDLDEYPPKIKISDLEYESLAGELKIHLPEGASGYVILPRPDRHYRAYVDGEKKPIEKYLDVMPAVYVENSSQVLIKEKSFFPLTGFIISFVSLSLFVILLFIREIIGTKWSLR